MRFHAVTVMTFAVVLPGLLANAAEQADVTRTQRLTWFKEAKFGMFIYWGPYSMMAGEWKGRQLPPGTNCEWIMHSLQIPRNTRQRKDHRFPPRTTDRSSGHGGGASNQRPAAC